MRMFAWLLSPLILLGLAISVIQARLSKESAFFQEDSERTRQAVLARIPIGTEISQAQKIMEAEGFVCSKLHDVKFADDRPGGGPQILHPPADILWCDSGQRSTKRLFVSKRWQIGFVDEDGLVSRIAVGVGLIGS